MSVATLQQFGQSLPSWLALVQRGETVAIVDGGHELARLVPPEKQKTVTAPPAWSWKDHLAELEAIFPEPVIGASEELEKSRGERF
ncbi:MAG: type II toxin-antitoxin system Phd/YefM family antitoxin [Prosthecobacter sp.]|uniref:type II toxin-antitoxin system Phd/YefM family antitoxin n=1 Tax=Prosthecobacter sp. TaxID=1965333 RepID=UPI0039011BC5